MARLFGLVALLALASPAAAFLLGGPVTSAGLRHGAGMSCIQQPRGAMSLRGARRMGMGGLRMIDADGMNQKEEEEAPVTTLSEDDLDARIAALGLGGENGVEDKSTGEEDIKKMSSIENVQEQSVAIGKKAIGLAASGAISLLNTIEQPLPEEDWKKQMEEAKAAKKAAAKKEEEANNMVDAGGVIAVLPVVVISVLLGGYAIASDLALF